MKKLFTILLITLQTYLFAQKVIVEDSYEMVFEKNILGLSILLEIDEENVVYAWEKRLKEWGGYKSKSKVYTCEKAFIPNIAINPFKVISKVYSTKKGVKVWYSFDDSTVVLNSTTNNKVYLAARKLLYDFGLELYIADINIQIKEAEKALANSVKEQEKLIDKGNDIRTKMSYNRQEKIKYEQKIKDTDTAYVKLQTEIELNITSQKSANENVEKMKRAVEVVRSKINKLE